MICHARQQSLGVGPLKSYPYDTFSEFKSDV